MFEIDHLTSYVLDWATGVLGTAGARVVVEEIAKGKARERDVLRALEQPGASEWAQFSPAACEIIRVARDGPVHASQLPASPEMLRRSPALRSVPASTPSDPLASTTVMSPPARSPLGGLERAQRVEALGHELRKRVADRQPSADVMRELMSLLRIPVGETPGTGFEDWYARGFDIFENPACVTQDVVEWCLSILRDEDHWDRHVRRAIDVLESCDLTLRQRALAIQASEIRDRPITSFFIQQGSVAIERVASWRSYAQAWEDAEVLRDVLRVSRPSSQDVEMLLAALDRGFAQDRTTAIAILLEHPELQSAPLKASIVRACEDCDDVVREAARALRTARGL